MIVWIINFIAVYIAIGCICTLVAGMKSNKDVFYEQELKIVMKILFMWGWKYKKLAKELKEIR